MIKNNEKGFISIIDGILAITLLLIVFSLFNFIISSQTLDYSHNFNEFKDSQDVMEILSNKINFEDKSILEKAEFILKSNNNSKSSIKEVSLLVNESFHILIPNSNYLFTENNYLKGEEISYNGDFTMAENVSVAIRQVGNYSFVLYIW